MNGAESLVKTLLASGVDTCFANPGTSEMHFVAALDRVPGMRCIPGLAEGVVTGAADGYARMAGRPASTLLHCGPGLANGLANLHNARRGRTPIVNLIGDQASYHRPLDPPLTTETEALARTVSAWTRTCASARNVGADAAAAVAAARSAPGGVASLILPSDVCWDEGGVVAAARPVTGPLPADGARIAQVAEVLRRKEKTVLLIAGGALRGPALRDAARIAQRTGAQLLAPMSNARMERGSDAPFVPRVPYALDAALAFFAEVEHLVLVGAAAPVAFFAYPGKPGTALAPQTRVHVLAHPDEDLADALAQLAQAVGAARWNHPSASRQQPASGAMSLEALAQSLAALLPENAIVIDESVSSGRALFPAFQSAAPHDWLQLTGGAIGEGIPLAVGAAVAAPQRRVVGLQADGSALYTVQALWTQARERLDVTTVILSNRRYAILHHELAQVGAAAGAAAQGLFGLGNPDLDWVRLSGGFGVEGGKASSMEQFNDLMQHANRRSGPFLIEADLGN